AAVPATATATVTVTATATATAGLLRRRDPFRQEPAAARHRGARGDRRRGARAPAQPAPRGDHRRSRRSFGSRRAERRAQRGARAHGGESAAAPGDRRGSHPHRGFRRAAASRRRGAFTPCRDHLRGRAGMTELWVASLIGAALFFGAGVFAARRSRNGLAARMALERALAEQRFAAGGAPRGPPP